MLSSKHVSVHAEAIGVLPSGCGSLSEVENLADLVRRRLSWLWSFTYTREDQEKLIHVGTFATLGIHLVNQDEDDGADGSDREDPGLSSSVSTGSDIA